MSNYFRTKKIQSDIQKIKEKLGIVEVDGFNMPEEEIEEELELETLSEEEKRQFEKLNIEIEKELESFTRAKDDDKQEEG